MVKPDRWIIEKGQGGMISPFSPEKVKRGISYGVSSYGYDFILSEEFMLFSGGEKISPKLIGEGSFSAFKGRTCTVPPNSFILGKSLEYFRIPRDILGVCFGKSTYARCGIVVNVTPLEPEWEGFLTVQIANLSPVPAEVYSGEGIAQIVFLEAADVCDKSYKDSGGKYQSAKGIEPSKGY